MAIANIVLRIYELSSQICRHPILKDMEQGKLSREKWRRWAKQRYLLSQGFLPFLEKLVDACDEQFKELSFTLSQNLLDEIGHRDGEIVEDEVHATWSRDFYEALGVDIQSTRPTHGTKRASRLLYNDDDFYEAVGALLFLEFHIPMEYLSVRSGMFLTYPDAFIDEPDDPPDVRAAKWKARRYICDHIVHDFGLHYPLLLWALNGINPIQNEKIMRGIERAAQAKHAFYHGLVLDALGT